MFDSRVTPSRRWAWLRASLTALGLLSGAARAETLTVAVGIDPGYVAFFVAKEEKLFEKHGLDVKLSPFASGAETMDSLNAGAAVLAASAEPTVLTRMARGDIRALGVVAESGSFLKLVARKEVATPAEIKAFGFVPGGALEYLTSLTARKYGLDAATRKVRAGPPEMPALLVRGDIDAFWLFEPFTAKAVDNGGRILATSGDVGYVYNFWVTASGAWFENHRDEAGRVLRALDEACMITTRDPARAAEAGRRQIKLPVEQTLGFLKTVTCRMRDFTPADFASYDAIADFLAEAKITSVRVDYRKSMAVGFWQDR